MKEDFPKISIIMPIYNGEEYLSEAIESVISQKYKNWELIAINDGSRDKSQTILNHYQEIEKRIIIINNEDNKGLQHTLNLGLKYATGLYVARIDSDDIWINQNKLNLQIDQFRKNEKLVLIGTWALVGETPDKINYLSSPPENDDEIRKKIIGRNPFIHSSVMFKKESALFFNGYNESKESKHVEDYSLWLSLGTIGEMKNIPLPLIFYRLHEKQISKNVRIQILKSIKLAFRFKKIYPKYTLGLFGSIIRLIIYGFLKLSPSTFQRLLKNFRPKAVSKSNQN